MVINADSQFRIENGLHKKTNVKARSSISQTASHNALGVFARGRSIQQYDNENCDLDR